MARFLSLMVILGMLGLFAGQSNAFSMSCYAQCMMVCMQGGIGASSSNHGLQQKQQSPAVVFDSDSGYDTDGLISCGIKCIKECRHPPAMPPPETPVPLPPTPEAPQVPAPVPPTPEAPQVPAPVPPTPEAPKAPEAPQPSTPSPSPSPPPCVALASEEVAGIVGKLNDYCKLGCATHLCARLSTTEKLAPAEIMNCVENCSQMCNRRY